MLVSVNLMTCFPPWNYLLPLCPLLPWTHILTDFIYAIMFKQFCVLSEKCLFNWRFPTLASKQNFLTSTRDPFQYSLSSATRQMPGRSVLLFQLLFTLLLGVSTSCWPSLIHFSTLLLFFYSLLLVCMCMLHVVVHDLHTSHGVHMEFREQPWDQFSPFVLFWDRDDLLLFDTITQGWWPVSIGDSPASVSCSHTWIYKCLRVWSQILEFMWSML